jgi:hypothetical protein
MNGSKRRIIVGWRRVAPQWPLRGHARILQRRPCGRGTRPTPRHQRSFGFSGAMYSGIQTSAPVRVLYAAQRSVDLSTLPRICLRCAAEHAHSRLLVSRWRRARTARHSRGRQGMLRRVSSLPPLQVRVTAASRPMNECMSRWTGIGRTLRAPSLSYCTVLPAFCAQDLRASVTRDRKRKELRLRVVDTNE